MKKLATIEKILEIKEHPNADSLEIAKVKGWNVIVKKGEFSVGDLCIYIQVDSIAPDWPQFEFLRNKHFRIRPIRLRGVMSQGLVLSLGDFPGLSLVYPISGFDLTKLLQIKHYEKPIPMGGEQAGQFPTDLVSKTDEDLIQNFPEIFEYLKGKKVYISLKHDGTSGTYVKSNGHFYACSRNWEMKEGNNAYWKIAEKYNLDKIPENLVIQGEIVGPQIQKNPEKLTEIQFRIFNIIDNGNGETYSGFDLESFCSVNFSTVLTPVEHVFTGIFNFNTMEELEDFTAEQKYASGKQAEGIVIRMEPPEYSQILGKMLSVKVKNADYAAKE